MKEPHDILKAYIERLLALEQQTQTQVEPDDLRALAREMGLSDAQWQTLQDQAEAHYRRGTGFAQYRNWDDAIAELTQAAAIQPFRTEVLQALAGAHHLRWQQHRRDEDRRLAESYARRCLQIEPQHDASLKLLSDLRSKPAPTSRAVGAWVVLALLGIVVGTGVFLLWSNQPQPRVEVPTPDAPQPQPQPAADLAVPVEWIAPARGGLALMPSSSAIDTYTDAYTYCLQGHLHLTGVGVSQLSLAVELLDAAGSVVHSDTHEVWGTHQPVLRDGDLLPVPWQDYVKASPLPTVARARVQVAAAAIQPSQGPFAPSPDLPPTWDPAPPSNVNLALRLRKRQAGARFGDNVYEAIALEAENTGQVPLRTLKLELRWYEGERLLASRDLWMVASDDPALVPGQVRVDGGTYEVPATPASRLEVAVSQLDY
ncbi:MAG: hypothetical protein OHK0039_34570 [Bacteroidia bacterium]